MSKASSTKATGGGGYTFADKVAAAFLAQMLRRKFPLETELGSIADLHFETRDAGNLLDDLMLVLRQGPNQTRCVVSVKSNRQLTKAGFSGEFVQDAWEQWNGGGAGFNSTTDILGLIVGEIDEPTLHDWEELQKQAASTSPERLVARIENDSQFSNTQKNIFASLRKSASGVERDATEAARLAARLRVLRFSDNSEGDYLNLCAEIVRQGTLEEGGKLWSRVLQLAAENRATGGYFDLAKLTRLLRPDFDLVDHPDFTSDWNKVISISSENIKSIRNVIGSGIQLAREDSRNRLREETDGHTVLLVVGESGSGKSAAIAHLMSVDGTFNRIVWLTAEQLSRSSQIELAHGFALRHTIPELIANSATKGCALIVDAFEKFEGQALRRVIDLLRAVREEALAGWKVIVTCQPQAIEAAHDALIEAGISDSGRVEFEKPALQEILDAVRTLPGLQALLLRAELQPILRNLTVLDWVVREDVAQRLQTARTWIGETELIDSIWGRWQGAGTKGFSRDALLRTLGKREGERLSGAVHVDSIPATELPLLGTLVQEGLIKANGPSVQFAHDLMGDWARYRCLKFEVANAPRAIKTFAPVPRWGRAIRLYAQSLAEQGSGLSDWKAAVSELTGDGSDSTVAQDLFIDGLLFAPNAESLLEQVWPDLIATNGYILLRLLKRLPHVASIPDWRITGISDAKMAENAKVWFRIPQPLYWIPVLRVLNRHRGEVAKHALILAAGVCALWLRTMPVGMPGRQEGGLIALELAKEIQGLIAEGMPVGDKDKVIYEAALSAAPEFPDDVSQLALELCGRQPEPAHAIQRREEERARERTRREEWARQNPEKVRQRRALPPPISLYREGPLRPPAPDGPLRSVSDGFRSAVMQSQALVGLIVVRPEVAREVLLAVCIDEPKPSEPYGNDRHLFDPLGLADWRISYPAAYWKGPFSIFLQLAPQQGLDAIVRLVNYATERWTENGLRRKPMDEDRRKHSFEFEIDGQTVYWVGNGNVYAWHRFQAMHADTVESALMALEKWFYDEIEKGKDITPWINYIYEKGQSAAFAGLLVSVGLKYPPLFTNVLRPMLGNFYVYECQTNLAVNEQSESWAISLSGQLQEAIKLAADWNRMPHRRYLLRDVATSLMLEDEATGQYLAIRKREWVKLPQSDEKGRIHMEFFLARFDPANYTITPQGDGRVLITMRWPDHLENIAQRSEGEGRLKSLSLSLAIRARRLLEGQESLPPESVPEFARIVQELADWTGESDDSRRDYYRINSVAGGLAVLVIKHRSWLSENAAVEKWCMKAVRELKPVWDEHFSPMAINDHTAEAFLGEAGVVLLEEGNDEWILRLAFEGVTGAHYSSTLYTMWRAYLLRRQLGGKFTELINVMILWSALRHAAGHEPGPYTDETPRFARYKTALFRRYVRGKLAGSFVTLHRAELLGRRLTVRVERRSMSPEERRHRESHRQWLQERDDDHELDRDMPEIDLEVIQRGFGFLIAMLRGANSDDEVTLRHFIRELFESELRTLPMPAPDDARAEIQGTPYQFDTWVMGRVAEFIARANSVDVARTFYRPILERGPAAKYWVKDFLRSWITQGLGISTDVRGFARIWEDIVIYTETLPAWQPGEGNYFNRAESLAVDLMGLREVASAVLGDLRHRDLITIMMPTFERWGQRWLKYSSVAAWFADFLRTDSGRVLLPQGVKQLNGIVSILPDRDWHNHDLGSLFADVLSLCWKHSRRDIEKDTELRQAFLSFLAVLSARQIPEALHLRANVSEVFATVGD